MSPGTTAPPPEDEGTQSSAHPRDPLPDSNGVDACDEDDLSAEAALSPEKIRAIVRLIQCRHCGLPLREAVILPCGRSLCKQCLPEPHVRHNVSYPATANRLQGISCPFPECGREHALGGCGVDVTLNKVVGLLRTQFEAAAAAAEGSSIGDGLSLKTTVHVRDPWDAAGLPSLGDRESVQHTFHGARLVATYCLADMGELGYDTEVTYTTSETASNGSDNGPGNDASARSDIAVLRDLRAGARGELDCQVCYALFYDPVTTECGHTFCRGCLRRVLDHASYCPICRRALQISPLLDSRACPSSETLTAIITGFWPEAVVSRGEAIAAEDLGTTRELEVPIFVCTLAFPTMPTFLHIFEPRYRLMVRRAMEGNRTFGMVMPRRPRGNDGDYADGHFAAVGTLLRIENVEYFVDGRSVLETVGISRFRILRHRFLDGYVVGQTERVDDIGIAEEEALETAETTAARTPQPEIPTTDPSHITIETNFDSMSTHALLSYARSFVDRMRGGNVMAIYGECPSDPAAFSWWFASVLPVSESAKYEMLTTRSVRGRLKVCCRWVQVMEIRRW